MRKRETNQGLTVNAIAGSHVVLLGIDITNALRRGLRGFAVQRTDHDEGETIWLRGMKVFQSVVPHPAPGVTYPTLAQPVQSFQWADYSVYPGRQYTYKVVALYGPADKLEQRRTVSVDVTAEPVEGATHTINFNRGSVATQEYARRFGNRPPEQAGPQAFKWLSRGLEESILDFIARAADDKFGLKGAFYEFQQPEVLAALKQAADRGAAIDIVFDAVPHKTASAGPAPANEKAVAAADIAATTTPRTHAKLMHNKFLVLTQSRRGKDQPVAVLTGSTNLTVNGLFGHANCTHVVEDPTIAGAYLEYHAKLRTDPPVAAPYRKWNQDHSPAPADLAGGMAAVFSPRPDLGALDWYAKLAAGAQNGLFMTFAFGMNQLFRDVYGKQDDVLRYGLMEKAWNGAHKDVQIAAIRALAARPNVVIAIGNRIHLNGLDQWLDERESIVHGAHVYWIHLKFMLVDPLSDHPTIITGSANFSDASTKTNDENMLIVQGDTRVADIYLGEYMRLHSHYAYRQAVAIFLEQHPGAKPEDMKLGFLIEDEDWTKPYFDPNDRSARMARRLYFAGR